MEEQEKELEQDDWKVELHKELITAMMGDAAEKNRAYVEVGYYYNCYAPASLYKYYPDTSLKLHSVKNNQMWYSAPCKFNDVFDCDISIDDQKVLDESMKVFPNERKIRPGSKVWKDFRSAMRQQLRMLKNKFDELRNTMGVACFSEEESSLLMWAHYANNHRGICVEYNLLEINSVLGFTAIPIIYSGERTCFNFFELHNMETHAVQLFLRSLTHKSPEWRYEKEWRIVREKASCGDKWDDNKKGALLEMIQPSSIILGCAAEPQFEQEVKEYCNSNRINLYKMEKDPIQYRLNKNVLLKFNTD